MARKAKVTKSATVASTTHKSIREPRVSLVDSLLAKKPGIKGNVKLTEEQQERMREEQPSDAQISRLRKFGFSEDEIEAMNKFDASEAITQKIHEFRLRDSEPASKEQLEGLVKWGYKMRDIQGLTRGEVSMLFRKLAEGKSKKA